MQEGQAGSSATALRFALPVVWAAGVLSALGAEITGLAIADLGPSGRTWGLAHLGIALGVWVLCNAAALGLLHYGLFRLSPLPQYSARTSIRTLLLGSGCVIALSNAVTPGGARPAFGSLTMLLLTVPYPLAYLLIEARRRGPMIVTAATALVVAGTAVPLRDAQERLVVRSWLSSHPGVDRALLATVDWPGAAPELHLATGPFGARTTVRYLGDDIGQGGVVTVSPPATDPCATLAELASHDRPGAPAGSIVGARPERCVRTGARSWALAHGAWSGYALRRDGVLVTLSVNSPGHRPDLAAVARTLHPVDDAGLWPYLQGDSGVPLLLK
ncbi:hypothetical protein [Streptomyces sp. NPDC001380]|uniref:hypothetical protein n=1 Tax=Streptomyces sp. NPDC001380 TaxID=3364566 RepID=UPI0036B85697